MRWLTHFSIRRQLMAIILLTTTVALVLAAVSFAAFDLEAFEEDLAHNVAIIGDVAQMVGNNTTAALLFEDREAAQEALASLRGKPGIHCAIIFDQNGQVFAHFEGVHHEDHAAPPALRADGSSFEQDSLILFRPIELNGERLGTIYLQAGFEGIQARIRRYAGIALSVLAASLLVAFVVSAALQRVISVPLLRLAEVADRVSREEDYSLRATEERKDEIGVLNRSFNNMLGQIQQRDAAVVERTAALQQEVAERTRAEQQIRNRTARLDALVYNNPQAIVLVDNEHRVQMCNPAFEKMFGYSETETVGHRLDELVSPPDLVPEAAALTQRSVSGETVQTISRRRRKDGSVVEVEIYGVPLLLDGQLLGGYGLYVDVTEQRKLENQLRQSQKMESLGQLAGGVAHDFNNLLGVIIGYSDLLLDKHPAESPEHKNLEEIKKAGKRAAALTRQLLAFSRKQLLQPRVLDLNATVADMDKMLQRLIGEDVALVTVPGPRLGCVKVDPSQIEQVILNLAVNARDAMPKGGKLTIETASVELTEAYAARHAALKPGSYVMLAVSDTGVGMDADTQARIFDPFFTTKGPGKGTGLGLATVYGIVKQSDGFIWVYSEPDKGATFKIYFPRVNEEAPAAAAKPGEKPTRGTEVILLVEDEEALRELARQSLSMHGYSVLEAADPEHAVKLSKAYHAPIDLMVTDVIMPGMSGPELAQILLRARPDMKLLYVSGYTDEAIVHHGVLDRDTAFLHKPFGTAELASKVREVLDKPEMLPPAPEPDGAFVRVF